MAHVHQFDTGDFDLEEVPPASEIIDGLFVGTAEAGIEATVGANSKQIRYILNVGGCVTPAIFAAVAEALADEGSSVPKLGDQVGHRGE